MRCSLRALAPSRRWRAGIALAALLTLAGGAVLVQAQTPSNGITVTGQGSATLPADEAVINGSVQTNADTASDALAQNAQAEQAVVAAANAFLAGEGSVQTTNINVYPQYSQPQPFVNGTPVPTAGPPQIVGYQASTGIEVTTTQIDKLGDFVQALVNAGLNQLNGVQFTLQNPEQLRTMALQAAIDDAKTQAQTAAERLGVTLGAVENVQIGYSNAPFPVFAATPPPLATAARGGVPIPQAPPIVAPGPLTANTTVTITFAIVPSSGQ